MGEKRHEDRGEEREVPAHPLRIGSATGGLKLKGTARRAERHLQETSR